MRRGVAVTILFGLALLAAACGGAPKSHYYVLDLPQAVPAPDRAGLDIGVRAFDIDPPFDQDRIVYRVGAHSPEVGFYAYHHWAVPLTRMLPKAVAAGLAGTEGVGSIEPAQPGLHYDAVLRGRLITLEEIDEPSGQHVRIRLSLSLHQDNAVLWSYDLTAEGSAQTDEVREIVDEMNRTLAQALEAARTDLARTLASTS